jgi:hypothetical protein
VNWQGRLGYAAGIFDGEGNIGSHMTRGRSGVHGPYTQLTVGMNDREPVQAMQDMFGGSVFRRASGLWVWKVYRFEHVQAAIAMMWTFLSPRRRARAAELLMLDVRRR